MVHWPLSSPDDQVQSAGHSCCLSSNVLHMPHCLLLKDNQCFASAWLPVNTTAEPGLNQSWLRAEHHRSELPTWEDLWYSMQIRDPAPAKPDHVFLPTILARWAAAESDLVVHHCLH